MKEYSIPEQLLNEILQYLGGRPYIEVAPIIAKIGQVIEGRKVIPFKKEEIGNDAEVSVRTLPNTDIVPVFVPAIVFPLNISIGLTSVALFGKLALNNSIGK